MTWYLNVVTALQYYLQEITYYTRYDVIQDMMWYLNVVTALQYYLQEITYYTRND
jgi:hypothetical protein